MSSVSFLENLLDGIEVEWKALGDVAEIYGGLTGKSKADFGNGNAKYISYKNIFDNIAVNFDILESVKVSDYENQHEVKYGDVLFTGSSETSDEAGMSASVTTQLKDSIYLNSFSFGIRFNEGIQLTPEFSKYLFRSNFMRDEISKTASGVTRFNISKTRFKKIKIPIPCPENPEKSLNIQAEIVRILDAFAELTNELTNELNARKKQYNHYRDQLLSFEEGEVEWKTLGELCSIGVGQATIGDEIGEYAFVNAGTTPSGYVTTYNTEPDTITTPSRGQGGIGYVGYQTAHFWCGPLCYRIRSTSKLLSTRFLYHFMANSMKDIVGLANMTGVPALNKKDLVGFPVPTPPPAQQERIVAILDKFDTLTNSISEGLPREISLRQKQYEHYRDLLFSFQKPEEVAN